MIGGSISAENDLRSYMLVCRQTNGAVNWPQSGVWRRRYVKLYDHPDGLTAVQVAAKYKQLADMDEPLSTYTRRLQSRRQGYQLVRNPRPENLVMLLQGKISKLVELALVSCRLIKLQMPIKAPSLAGAASIYLSSPSTSTAPACFHGRWTSTKKQLCLARLDKPCARSKPRRSITISRCKGPTRAPTSD